MNLKKLKRFAFTDDRTFFDWTHIFNSKKMMEVFSLFRRYFRLDTKLLCNFLTLFFGGDLNRDKTGNPLICSFTVCNIKRILAWRWWTKMKMHTTFASYVAKVPLRKLIW
jgi:hypothetical protein